MSTAKPNKETLNQALNSLKTFIENTDFQNQPMEKGNVRRYDISAYETENFDEGKRKFNSETMPELDYLSILGDNVDRYSNCLDAIFKAINPEVIDRQAVEEYVEQAVIKSVDPAQRYQYISFSNRISKSVTTLAAQLRADPTEFEVDLQVDGLSNEGLPLKFGKFEFRAADEIMHRKVMRSAKHVMRLSPDTPKTKTNFITHFNDQYLNLWDKKSVAVIKISAVTSEAARSQAMRELRDTLDVINFFADFSNNTGNGGCVSMPGDWGNASSLCLTLGKDYSQQLE
jgi:hypothetical protein